MRVGNLSGRLVLQVGEGVVDVERASGGALPTDPQAAFDRWDELVAWAASAAPAQGEPFEESELGPPAPRPRQVFGIGLNYRDHAAETGRPPPQEPMVFAKFVSAITGPYGDITVPPGNVDWEVELVVVIGRRAWQVAESEAWSHVAGLTVGQDVSERRGQFIGDPAQFSLAKSHPGFGPMGPWLVTPDEVSDPDDLALGCRLNGEQVQASRTSELIFPVPVLVARLSAILPLLPGDAIFTGTPSGVGGRRQPPRFLGPGDELVSEIEGIGQMRHRFVAPSP
jgi:2,4-didehydro-3-deoxy-L-rhamnonate hydrolase